MNTCEGCANFGLATEGIRWPTATNGDKSRAWVERCDSCCYCESDEEAALLLLQDLFAADAEILDAGMAVPVGQQVMQPYVEL